MWTLIKMLGKGPGQAGCRPGFCVKLTPVLSPCAAVQALETSVYDVYLEAETAWALGFNAQGLSEEEEDLLPPGADEASYVQVGACLTLIVY